MAYIYGKDKGGFLEGTETADVIKGAGGIDILHGNEGDDVLLGFGGNDRIKGGSGNDTLNGGSYNSGNDYLDGGLGIDTMYGGAGNDTYIVDNEDDKVIEKAKDALGGSSSGGIDTVRSSVSYSINGYNEGDVGFGIENLTLTGTAITAKGNNLDNIIEGNNSDNYITGWDGNDFLFGGIGNDSLYGGDGNDNLFGGDGNDHLFGHDGSDTLTGGLGADTFYFYSVSDSPVGVGSDKITDFNKLEGDKINLIGFDANPLKSGFQHFREDQLSYDSDTGIFTADVTNGTDLQIEFIGGAPVGFDLVHDVIL